ncbi:EXOCYST COMPLEX PROTEIN EXO70 [Salix purpurea]|uniref:Exocyst subunit Exo70 family protein n=1 Tax=Salix purpurea TaxID=77065 RepID=A0A9Q0ZAU9_SALPP|nr:EXOCYST COMPLEX PROTEIN EXO70 [Salix purpurea]
MVPVKFSGKLQRRSSPSLNGSVPRLVSLVTDYCNRLLGDDYKPLLTQVLTIQQSWKQDKCQEELITSQIYYIIKQIGLNLDAWSKAHYDFTGFVGDLVKKRLKSFSVEFDHMYQKQNPTGLFQMKTLRLKMCKLVVQAFLPVYRSHLQNYGFQAETDASPCEIYYAKFGNHAQLSLSAKAKQVWKHQTQPLDW